MTAPQYIYATRKNDAFQHLIEAPGKPALCGTTEEHWHCRKTKHHFPGVPLCRECHLERNARKDEMKAAELREQTAAIRTFWTKERTS